jgi:hypothetical protein
MKRRVAAVTLATILGATAAYQMAKRDAYSIIPPPGRGTISEHRMASGTERNYTTALFTGFVAEQIAKEYHGGKANFEMRVEENGAEVKIAVDDLLKNVVLSTSNQKVHIAAQDQKYLLTRDAELWSIYRHPEEARHQTIINDNRDILPRGMMVVAEKGKVTGIYQGTEGIWRLTGSYRNNDVDLQIDVPGLYDMNAKGYIKKPTQ